MTYFERHEIQFICDNKICKHQDLLILRKRPETKIVCPMCGFKTFREKRMIEFLSEKELEEFRARTEILIQQLNSKYR